VHNRELSLTHPKQREYDIVVNKLNNNELCKMEEIIEDLEEYKNQDDDEESIDNSYDKCEDATSSKGQLSIMVAMNTDCSINDASR